MKVTLTKVFISDKNKAGEELINKFGKKYWKVLLKTQEHGDKWVSGFGNSKDEPHMSWKEGDEVNIEVTENGDYLNFKPVDERDALAERVAILEKDIKFLKSIALGKGMEDLPDDTEAVNIDEIPF